MIDLSDLAVCDAEADVAAFRLGPVNDADADARRDYLDVTAVGRFSIGTSRSRR